VSAALRSRLPLRRGKAGARRSAEQTVADRREEASPARGRDARFRALGGIDAGGLLGGRGIAVELQPSSVSSGIVHSMAPVAIDLQSASATAPDRMPQGEDDVAGLFSRHSAPTYGRALTSPRSSSLTKPPRCRHAYLWHRPRAGVRRLRSAGDRPGERGSPRGASRVRRGAESVDDAPLGQLDFLYMPSRYVERDLAFYRGVMGRRLVFAIEAFGARVARVGLTGGGPRLLLAGHPGGDAPVLVYRWATSTRRWPSSSAAGCARGALRHPARAVRGLARARRAAAPSTS
jgi:hypothetical protein